MGEQMHTWLGSYDGAASPNTLRSSPMIFLSKTNDS